MKPNLRDYTEGMLFALDLVQNRIDEGASVEELSAGVDGLVEATEKVLGMTDRIRARAGEREWRSWAQTQAIPKDQAA